MGNESFSEPVEKLQFLKCHCFCYSCMEVAALFELFAVNMTTNTNSRKIRRISYQTQSVLKLELETCKVVYK